MCYNFHVILAENYYMGEYLIMSISEKVCEQKQLLISKRSIISFFLAVSSYVLLSSAVLFKAFPKTLGALAPLIVIIFMITSFILSIIDLKKTHGKKFLSIIALILSSLYFILIIGSIIILVLLG